MSDPIKPTPEENARLDYLAKKRDLDLQDNSQVYDALHSATIRHLAALVQAGQATAADIANARQILRDNGITSTNPNQSSPVANLAKVLPFTGDDAEVG